jgi:hypothetical protein
MERLFTSSFGIHLDARSELKDTSEIMGEQKTMGLDRSGSHTPSRIQAQGASAVGSFLAVQIPNRRSEKQKAAPDLVLSGSHQFRKGISCSSSNSKIAVARIFAGRFCSTGDPHLVVAPWSLFCGDSPTVGALATAPGAIAQFDNTR